MIQWLRGVAMIKLPIDLEQHKTDYYNLKIKLKEQGLMDEKEYLKIPLSHYQFEERTGKKITEGRIINEPYRDLNELEIAMLEQLWFLDGTLNITSTGEMTLEYYID